MGLGIPSSVLFKGGITTWRLATAVAVCSILEGVVRQIWVSGETQRCLFIAMMFCSLKACLVWLAKESRLHVGLRSSAIEDAGHEALWLSYWTRCAQGMCEVGFDFTHEEASASD